VLLPAVDRAIVKKATKGYSNTQLSVLLFPAVDRAIVKKATKAIQ